MGFLRLVLRGLVHRRRAHTGVVLSAAVCTAVLVGALMAQDSIGFSLAELVDRRLGSIDAATETGERLFAAHLATRLSNNSDVEAVAALMTDGSVLIRGGEGRVPDVRVIGIPGDFGSLGPGSPSAASLSPAPGRAVLNRRLADRLGAEGGDTVIVRMARLTAMPGEAPLADGADDGVTVRCIVEAVAEADEFGDFSLRTNQVAPFNLFLDRDYMASLHGLHDRANLLLVAGGHVTPDRAQRALGEIWTIQDAGLSVRNIGDATEVISDRVFIDRTVTEAAVEIGAQPVLTYFVDTLQAGTNRVPYSFVAAGLDAASPTGAAEPAIVLNDWTAADLDVAIGDTVDLAYRVPGEGGGLVTQTSRFRVSNIIPVEENHRLLMPAFPGFENVSNCRDWRPGAPIDISLIRDRDEEYWDRYGGAPKAFVTMDAAISMWSNRYGQATALRFADDAKSVSMALSQRLGPENFGLVLLPVRTLAEQSSAGTTDFGGLFLGLSFFLLGAAVLLTGLLFSLVAIDRAQETATYLSVGYRPRVVRRLLVTEGAILALVGAALGVILGVYYNRLIIWALSSVWSDAVRFSGLRQHVRVVTLLVGGGGGLLVSFCTLWVGAAHQARLTPSQTRQTTVRRPRRRMSVIAIVAAAVMMAAGVIISRGGSRTTEAFFLMGTGLLVMFLAAFARLLSTERRRDLSGPLPLLRLAGCGVTRRRRRALTVAALLASGVFVVLAVGANRHVATSAWNRQESGTGGFELILETDVPVLVDPVGEEGQRRYRLDKALLQDVSSVGFRVRAGDDASCLNLNRVTAPRVLGVDPRDVQGAFAFVDANAETPGSPWRLLEQSLGEDRVPAIADQTVIRWSLGKKLGDELVYHDEMGQEFRLVLVAGLRNSVFQGSVLIAESVFRERFPSVVGHELFLVDTPVTQTQLLSGELSRGLADSGGRVSETAERLATFYSVENTYLAIFMTLGWLGVLVGTVGLGAVVYRNLAESRAEMALLRAVGYRRGTVNRLALLEHLTPAMYGALTGGIAAIVAVLPATAGEGRGISVGTAAILLSAVLLSSILSTAVGAYLASPRDFLVALRHE